MNAPFLCGPWVHQFSMGPCPLQGLVLCHHYIIYTFELLTVHILLGQLCTDDVQVDLRSVAYNAMEPGVPWWHHQSTYCSMFNTSKTQFICIIVAEVQVTMGLEKGVAKLDIATLAADFPSRIIFSSVIHKLGVVQKKELIYAS